ncbi:MAG: hypothetical protein AAF959_25325 [Cyanobacteria bacterium P01_D01_bin.56]
MTSLRDRKGLLFNLRKRLWLNAIVRPLVMSMVILMTVSSVIPTNSQAGSLHVPVSSQVQQHHAKDSASAPLPLSMQTRVRLRHHHRVTGATMTDHQLTTAHLFSHRSLGELSSENPQNSKHG